MTEVFESFTMDFTSRIQHAQNKDGKWFRRCQYRDQRYGYKWTAWKASHFNPEGRRGELLRVRLPR